jgi:hypothetical protein
MTPKRKPTLKRAVPSTHAVLLTGLAMLAAACNAPGFELAPVDFDLGEPDPEAQSEPLAEAPDVIAPPNPESQPQPAQSVGSTEPGRLSAAECDAIDHVAVEFGEPREFYAGTLDYQCFFDLYYLWPGSTQEDLAVFVHSYVTSSGNAYNDWTEHIMGPHHPETGNRIFDQSSRVPEQVIDRREYIAIFITDPTYFEGCRWIFDDPLNSGVTVEQLKNPCR